MLSDLESSLEARNSAVILLNVIIRKKVVLNSNDLKYQMYSKYLCIFHLFDISYNISSFYTNKCEIFGDLQAITRGQHTQVTQSFNSIIIRGETCVLMFTRESLWNQLLVGFITMEINDMIEVYDVIYTSGLWFYKTRGEIAS